MFYSTATSLAAYIIGSSPLKGQDRYNPRRLDEIESKHPLRKSCNIKIGIWVYPYIHHTSKCPHQ